MVDVCMKFHQRRCLSVPETELHEQTKHCSAMLEKQVMVSNSQWQWAECIKADMCMKFQ